MVDEGHLEIWRREQLPGVQDGATRREVHLKRRAQAGGRASWPYYPSKDQRLHALSWKAVLSESKATINVGEAIDKPLETTRVA